LLGSPRSDPWFGLFSDQLDFRFGFDKNSGQEVIRNLRPRPHEAAVCPNSVGGAAGQSYAIIAFVQNPDQNGQVILLAGANAERTEAAGRLVTDLPRLSAAVHECEISANESHVHFELLLKLNTMAGTPMRHIWKRATSWRAALSVCSPVRFKHELTQPSPAFSTF
jgi:hypothetical protein